MTVIESSGNDERNGGENALNKSYDGLNHANCNRDTRAART